jgi:phospholipid N-methyltransferase
MKRKDSLLELGHGSGATTSQVLQHDSLPFNLILYSLSGVDSSAPKQLLQVIDESISVTVSDE